MEKDLLYQLALSRITGIGPIHGRNLINHFGEAKAIFLADMPVLTNICGKKNAAAILDFNGVQELEKEAGFLEKYSMRTLFITDQSYPQRLLPCEDAPVLLFYKGNTDLNAARIVSVIGTRNPSEYGKRITERLMQQLTSSGLTPPDLLIVSGLAYGIDGIAHQAALDNHLPTVGVLGHGLDRIYPQQHAPLAKKMVNQGGLLTKFNIDTRPAHHNFPVRNRIVAGMSDALIVVETDAKGGSLLTVKNAIEYKKKIFAFPGRINDPKSSGCNALIRNGKARLLIDGQQLIEEMKWGQPVKKQGSEQGKLFPPPTEEPDMPEEEKRLLRLFREKRNLSFDELSTEMKISQLAITLLNLELKGWIDALPGKRYRLRG